ncbi:MAG: hypothetical protein RIF37_00590 [Rhodospirillaceae bacterium]
MSILRELRALPPLQIIGAGTHTIPVPAGCVSWEAWLFGAGGSGGVARGIAAKATGGAGGCYAHIKRQLILDTSFLTVVLGAGGAAVNASLNNEAFAGNDGNSSSLTDGTLILIVPAGGGGKVTIDATTAPSSTASLTPTVNDDGNIDTALGGVSGACIGTAATYQASGGGSSGGPWGNGMPSGAVLSGNYAATGGASPFFSSGTADGANAMSGGAGIGGKSADSTGSGDSGGGGAFGPSIDLNPGPGEGPTNSTNNVAPAVGSTSGLLFDQRGSGRGGYSGGSIPLGDGGPGAGGAAQYYTYPSGSYPVFAGHGGHMGGGGAIQPAGGGVVQGAYDRPDGGAFAGGGAAISATKPVYGGAGGLGAGGGAAVSSSSAAVSGKGGDAYVAIIFYATS